MSLPQLLELVLGRQRRTFLLVLGAAFAVAMIVTFALPKQYRAESTLFVGESRPLSTGASTVQLDEVLARTYVELLRTPDVERDVGRALPFRLGRDELASQVGIEVVTGTRLIRLSALDGDPERARAIANAYASSFVERQRRSAADVSREQQRALRDRIGALAQNIQRLSAPADVGARAQNETELQAARDAYVAAEQSQLLQGSNVSLASRATLPTAAAKPRPKLYLAVGLVLALALAVAAAVLRDRLDDRLRDEDELLGLVGVPVLARVPLQPPGHEAATGEAFDILRANLAAGDPDGARRVIAVTSALEEEGKSFTVAGLAGAFARLGTPVLAVDCDLRRPSLSTVLKGGAAKGLTNLLVEAPRHPEDLVVPTAIRGVRLLPSGPLPPSPSALLGLARLREVLDDLRARHDHVLVDTPPATVGADLTALAPAVDGVVLVVDLARARRRAVTTTRDQLARTATPVVGLVLNRIRGGDRPFGLGGYGPRATGAAATNGVGRRTPVGAWVAASWSRAQQGLGGRPGRREAPTPEERDDE